MRLPARFIRTIHLPATAERYWLASDEETLGFIRKELLFEVGLVERLEEGILHSLVGNRAGSPVAGQYVRAPVKRNQPAHYALHQAIIVPARKIAAPDAAVPQSSAQVSVCSPESVAAAVAAGHLEMTQSGNYRIPERFFFISDSIIASLV